MRNAVGELGQNRAAERNGSQRTLLTLAVRDYGDGDESFTAGIDEQLDVVAEWWSSPVASDGFRHVPAPTVTRREHVEDFLRDNRVREMEGEALVLFITGHGHAGTRTHFLQLPDSVKGRHLNTSVRTTDLITAALDSHARNVLVIVNTCYAGKISGEIDDLVEDIRAERRNTCRLDVLVTAGHDRPVQVRRFSTLLRGALERLRTTAGITTPHLSVVELMSEFERGLDPAERKRHRLHRVVDGSGVLTPTPCIPNPGYRRVRELTGADGRHPGTPAGDHWLDRATGRTQEQDPGWYFRGREDINRSIAAFLSPARTRGVLLVTGSAGSGKSAVLARAVVLSDPAFRDDPLCKTALDLSGPDTVPAPGSITGAVLARHRGAAELAHDILEALGETPRRIRSTEDPVVEAAQQILAVLRDRDEAVTLVIDGLDEADERQRIIEDVLAPLNAFCAPRLDQVPVPRLDGEPFADRGRGLRLLIGVRSSRPLSEPSGELPEEEQGHNEALKAVFPTAEEQRTDDEGSEKDIAEYLHALICEGGGGHRDSAEEAAALVAPVVWPSFIDARIAGEQLRSVKDPAAVARQPEWQRMLNNGTEGLLRRDLVLVEADGLPSEVALALLRASAFAGGAGIPWSTIWPQMARVLLGRALPDWDEMIAKLLKSRLNGYLAHDHEDDRRVYRPAHETLAEALRDIDTDWLDRGGAA
ncbi:AAA family ATPase [Streptomyces sp. NPDC058542]|uniref:AAA family ATPase n=1 Tax=Streptomyces sp. NPDC058542 TaxID=3346543 RepID=UPI003662B7F6